MKRNKLRGTWKHIDGRYRAWTADYWLEVVATDYNWHWNITSHDDILIEAGCKPTMRAGQTEAMRAYGRQINVTLQSEVAK